MYMQKLIKRDENFDIEEYTLYMQALVTINVKIQKILSDWRYRKIKKYLILKKNTKRLIITYLMLIRLLMLFWIIIRHFYFAFICWVCVWWINFLYCNSKHFRNTIKFVAFSYSVSDILFYNKSIMRSFNIDYINRTISKNTYIKSSKIKKANRNLKYILNFKK